MGVSEKEDNKTPQMDMRIGYAAYNRLDSAMLTRTNCLKKAGRTLVLLFHTVSFVISCIFPEVYEWKCDDSILGLLNEGQLCIA